MPRKKDVSDAQFSFEVIAALIAASGVNVANRHYQLMAKVDPSRTASGYEHLFRAAKKRANEIQAMEANGELLGTPAKSPGKGKTAEKKDGATKAKAGAKRGELFPLRLNFEKLTNDSTGRRARKGESGEDDAETGSKKKVKTEEAESEGEVEDAAVDDDFN